jgi:MraZ protein
MRESFVINRNIFQKCLILYPLQFGQNIVNDISQLSKFSKENDTFIRQYTNGAIQVEVDNANRILLPKRLCEYASIEKDVVLVSNLNKIEIWSNKLYNELIENFDHNKFEELAEKVMSKIDKPKSN